MSKKIGLRQKRKPLKPTKEIVKGIVEKHTAEKQLAENAKGDSSKSRQGIFAEEISPLMNQFGETCHNLRIQAAVAILQDPKQPGEMEIAIRGNPYEASIIVAETLKRLKAIIAQELEV